MAVPDFQSLMLPLLRLATDGKEHSLGEARGTLSSQFKLTEADLEEVLPSGRQSKFANRVVWAKKYLQQAGLITTPRWGHFQIAQRGLDVLQSPPSRIDIKFLEQYPEFVAFRTPKQDIESSVHSLQTSLEAPQETAMETPEETLKAAHLRMRAGLASELLAKVKGGSPGFFERLVVELLLAMGYGGSRKDAGQAIGRSGDEGIDGVISEDRLEIDPERPFSGKSAPGTKGLWSQSSRKTAFPDRSLGACGE